MLAHEVLDLKIHFPMCKYCHLSLYLHLLRGKHISIIFSLSLCDLGVIIPIGCGGLCETLKRLYPPYNSIGIGSIKNPLLNNVIYRFIYIYYVFVNIVIFSLSLCDLGVIIPIGRGGLCKTSKRH